MNKSSISGNATKPESITLKYKGDGTSVSPKDRKYGGDTIFQNNDCPLTSEQFLRARQKFVLLENANSTNDRNASAGKDVNKNKNSSKPVEANRNLPKEFAEKSYSTINTEHEINPPFQPLLYEGSASTVSPVELNPNENLIYKTEAPMVLPNEKPCLSKECSGTTDLQREFDFKTIRNKFKNWAETPMVLPNEKPCLSKECSGTTDLQKEFDFKTIRNKFKNWAETPMVLNNEKPCCSKECSGTTDLQKECVFKRIRNKFKNWAEPKIDNVKRLIAKLKRKTKTSEHDGRDQVKKKKEYGKMIYEENNTKNDEGNNHRTNPK
ncbi:uncharacterized protein LOC119687661 isoform X1 [Teleopsis dalmanni]|uniref:uncharacterized protein LOC119687661 isoform X1 n=1 Tax=Teleopsis dalmanni TaxID=139649 RepID=UPI0018CCF1A1|nr:uncharacterized protein LOC119687661 isoform X1 [Teleopsis dalmanni]